MYIINWDIRKFITIYIMYVTCTFVFKYKIVNKKKYLPCYFLNSSYTTLYQYAYQ